MSSSRISYNRKRRSDDECSSSDSDEDALPIKRQRLWNREPSMFHKYLLYIGDTFLNKFKNFVHWIYELPAGYCEPEKMLKNSLDGHVPIDLEIDDEEDIDVVEINTDDDDPIIEEDIACNSDRASKRDSLRKNSFPISIITDPLSSSTPFYKTRGQILNSLSRSPVNGCNNKKTYVTRSKTSNISSQKKTNRCVAPITNPSSEVEILLDTRETPDEESDDLEIVSEIPNTKSSRRLTRQRVSPIKLSCSSKRYNIISSSNILNGKAESHERQGSSNKSFTAHEVIRLQEKAHYQLILDKMIGTSTYHPIAPKKDPKPAEIQIDLTEDDQPVIDNHLKKENLEKPVNEFLQKYYRPCHFKPCASPKNNLDDVETFTVDDDVQVIGRKEPDDKISIFTKVPKAKEHEKKSPILSSGIFSNDWINEFKKTIAIETEQRLQIVAAQEEKLERYRKRRDENILNEKILRGQSISTAPVGKDEFPELTPEMEERIDWALGSGIAEETLSTFKDCICTRTDMNTLAGLNWLNDSVINFYLALVKERNKNNAEYPLVYCFNSYFYISLRGRGPKAVMRWTRKIEDSKNIFDFDIVFVPLHLGMHWALCVIDNRTKKIKYYDSMQGTDDQSLRIMQNYLVAEKKDKLGIIMDLSEYSLEMVKDIPQQMNGSDCGMFTLKYAEFISRDVPITFSQEHMQYFRRRMVIEILEKKLF